MEEYTIDDSPPEMAPIDLTKKAVSPPSPVAVTCDTSVSPLQNEQTLDTYVQNETGELPVETDTPAVTRAEETPPSDIVPSESLREPPNVGQLPVETTTKVPTACPEDGLVLSQYPWKKSAMLKLDRLSSLSIDLWCNTIPDYYQFVPADTDALVKQENATVSNITTDNMGSSSPAKESENNYEADTDVDIDNLLHHTVTLVRQVKVELNTGNAEKPPEQGVSKLRPKRKRPSHVETSTTTNTSKKKKKASSNDVSAALDALHNQTLLQLQQVGKPPSSTKREHVIKCWLCTRTFSTTRDLNNHHWEEHGIVDCPQCDKKFTSQCSLNKHMYSHRELKFICEFCGKKFPFESRLEQHSIVHINKQHQCPVKRCSKEFKGIGDLNRHIDTHKKGVWHCCEFCSYKNKDKRNTDSHM